MKEKKEIKRKKKYKIKVKALIKLIVFVLVILFVSFFLFNIHIKNIYINGTTYVTDNEIISAAGIKNYPKLFKLSKSKMIKEIKRIPLVQDVKIKRNLLGQITINVTEYKVLFYYEYDKKYVASNGDMLAIDNAKGVPTLVNFTPDTIFEKLVVGLDKIDSNIISMINEIEYTPYRGSDGTIIDDTRFTLKMNDQNRIIMNTLNIKRLNDYNKIYASLGMDQLKGTLYLDTITDENIYFESYEAEQREEQERMRREQEEKEVESHE